MAEALARIDAWIASDEAAKLTPRMKEADIWTYTAETRKGKLVILTVNERAENFGHTERFFVRDGVLYHARRIGYSGGVNDLRRFDFANGRVLRAEQKGDILNDDPNHFEDLTNDKAALDDILGVLRRACRALRLPVPRY